MRNTVVRLLLAAGFTLVCSLSLLYRFDRSLDGITDPQFYEFARDHKLLSEDFALQVSDVAHIYMPSTRLWGRSININKPFERDALNIYLLQNPSSRQETANIACNCLTSPKNNTIYCDNKIIDSVVYSFDPRGDQTEHGAEDPDLTETMTQFANLRSTTLLSWLIGHEMGHVHFRHDRVAPGYLGIVDVQQGGDNRSYTRRALNAISRLWQSQQSAPTPTTYRTLKTVQEIENQADQFVIDNADPRQLASMQLDLYNFSGILRQLIHPKPQADGKFAVEYNPAFHPPLDYRAMNMAEQLNQPPLQHDPWYDEVFSQYDVKATREPTAKSCALEGSLSAGKGRRIDVDRVELNSLSLLHHVFTYAIDDVVHLDVIHSLLRDYGPTAGRRVEPDLQWVIYWLMAIEAESDPAGSSDAYQIFDRLHTRNGVQPEDMPSYIRLAKSYLEIEHGLVPFAAPEYMARLTALFGGRSEKRLVDNINDTAAEILADEQTDRETVNGAILSEMIEFSAVVDRSQSMPFSVSPMFWKLVRASIVRKRDGRSRNVVYPRAVHSSALRVRMPAELFDAVERRVGRLIEDRLTRDAALPVGEGELEEMSDLLDVGRSAESSSVEMAVIAAMRHRCASTGDRPCSDPEWLHSELLSRVDARDIHGAVMTAANDPNAFWRSALTHPKLLPAIQHSLRGDLDLYEPWLRVISHPPGNLTSVPELYSNLPCYEVETGTTVGVADLGALEACKVRTGADTGVDCTGVISEGMTACAQALEADMEIHVVDRDYARALKEMELLERMNSLINSAPFDQHTTVIIAGVSQTWQELKASIANQVRDNH